MQCYPKKRLANHRKDNLFLLPFGYEIFYPVWSGQNPFGVLVNV